MLAHSPRIVTENLVLLLDAANPRNFNLTAVEVLVVAGGGSAGSALYHSGGGGAGGLIYNSNFAVTPGTQLTANVGAGGAAPTTSGQKGNNGTDSVFGSLTAIGGGGGGTYQNATGLNGGSGGGGGAESTVFGAAGLGTTGQGFGGGNYDGSSGGVKRGGGGGGAGAPGQEGSGGAGGNGGNGLQFPQFVSVGGSPSGWFAGGGGGSTEVLNASTTGGLGGGGNGNYNTGQNGGANTGGGGGAGERVAPTTTGAGGSGIIIVRYPGPQKAIGGVVTSVGGDTIHTFTTSGNFTPLVNTNGSAVLGLSDLSGNRNFGDSGGSGVLYSSANGGSLSFDGVDDGVNIPHNSNIDIRNQITIECLFYLNSFTAGGPYTDRITIITKAYSYYMTIGPSGKIDVYFYGTGGYFSSNSSVNLNQWTHVVVTFNGSTINWYINSIIDKSLSQGGTITPERNGDLNIGRELFENYGRGMNGRISNAKIYNRALSAAEVSQNFNALRGRYGL